MDIMLQLEKLILDYAFEHRVIGHAFASHDNGCNSRFLSDCKCGILESHNLAWENADRLLMQILSTIEQNIKK